MYLALDFAVGVFGFFTMNLAVEPPLHNSWGDLGNEATFAYVIIPAILGVYILFGIFVYYLFRNNILSLS